MMETCNKNDGWDRQLRLGGRPPDQPRETHPPSRSDDRPAPFYIRGGSRSAVMKIPRRPKSLTNAGVAARVSHPQSAQGNRPAIPKSERRAPSHPCSEARRRLH